jgi:FixJ family two-component response regulator
VRRQLRRRGNRRVPRGPNRATAANPAGLTGRQVEVLGLLAEGLSDAEIAERLSLSATTSRRCSASSASSWPNLGSRTARVRESLPIPPPRAAP